MTVFVTVTITSLFCFLHQLCFYPHQNSQGTASVLFKVVQMEYSTLWRKYKSNSHKSGKLNKSFGCQGKEQISGSVELQDPFRDWAVVKKKRQSVFTVAKIQLRLCCLIQLHTSQTYVTTVVLGSFPAALIILSPSVVILLFDFAVEHFFTRVSLVKATCFQLKWKQRSRKEVTACLINQLSSAIQLLEMTFKPINITDRNVVLCSKLCQSGFVDVLNNPQLSWLLWKYVCIKMMLGSHLCVKIQICA